jgi:flavin reductase (DIM6/NTAB) family NADH-FMN oxidoreductase RutF
LPDNLGWSSAAERICEYNARISRQFKMLRPIERAADVDTFSGIFERLDRELWVVTASAGERRSGLVATYVARVSLVPELPRVTVALAKHHFTHELIEASGALAMHLVGEDQIEWVWRFGIRSGREVDKLHGLATSTGASGSPILSAAPAWLDCRVEARMDTGDRTVYLAEVLDAGVREERGVRREFGAGEGDTRSGAVLGRNTRVQQADDRLMGDGIPILTFQRLLELAPAEPLREMKQALDRDVKLDRAAILEWRRAADAASGHGRRRRGRNDNG